VRWDGPDGYFVSDDRALVDVARVHHWLSMKSYWAEGRPYGAVARSIEQSLTLGLYRPDGGMAGVARWVTDYSTFAWLCDVFVEPAERGHGRGTFLVATATSHPDIRDLHLQVLSTRDAHQLYRRFGFEASPTPERWMVRRAARLPPPPGAAGVRPADLPSAPPGSAGAPAADRTP
jgi:GNAT superfamily N-acetyltransferase